MVQMTVLDLVKSAMIDFMQNQIGSKIAKFHTVWFVPSHRASNLNF